MIRILGLIWASAWLSACATTYKDVRPRDVKDGQGVAVAKIKFLYNGKEFTEKCSVCINSINGPCQKLTPEGIFMLPLPKGANTLRRVACHDVSMQHHNLDDVSFDISSEVNYIGDIEVAWRNRGGFKTTQMLGVVGALIDESRNDGEVKLSVATSKKSLKQLSDIYRRQMASSAMKEAKMAPIKVK